jgi:hypothetical protein
MSRKSKTVSGEASGPFPIIPDDRDDGKPDSDALKILQAVGGILCGIFLLWLLLHTLLGLI